MESKSLEKRANRLSTAAKLAQEQVINKLAQEVSRLEMRLDDLENPTSDKIDVNELVSDIQKIKEDLWSTERKLELAKETYKELFEEPVAEGKKTKKD